MKKVIYIYSLCCAFLLNAQETFEVGKVIDSIPISNTDSENFALYLPKSFKPDELNSIVFIFEPMGRGKLGVQVFNQAAETYGHILVCSNNIRNGPYQSNFEATERMINHIFTKFNINEKQIYLAGFSGGSRLASAIASLTNMAAGVIACGAGFSASHAPSTQQFSYVGICGNKDMNFMEMTSVRQYLNKLKINNTLFTFDGNHRWPPQEQIVKAFDWLSIQAYKKGNIEKPKKAIDLSYNMNFEFAKGGENSENILHAIEEYERLFSTYKEFYTLDSISKKIETLKKSKEYKNALKLRKKAFEREDSQTEILSARFHDDFNNPKKANMPWWEKHLRKLKEEKESSDMELKNMKARMSYKIYAMAYEKMIFGTPKPNKEQVAFCKGVIKLIYPKFQ